MQPQGEVRDLPGGQRRRVPGAGAALAELRRHYLLDQVNFPVGRGLDRPQVPGLHSVLAERGYHPRDRERLRTVLPAHPADQAVVLELGQLLVVDSRRLEQLAPGQVSGRAPRGAAGARDRRTPGSATPHVPPPLLPAGEVVPRDGSWVAAAPEGSDGLPRPRLAPGPTRSRPL